MRKTGCLFLLLMSIACLQAQVRRDTLLLYFPSGSHDLDKAESDRLKAYVQRLDSFEVGGISLTGFCDDQGDTLRNYRLSMARAFHVRDRLLALGIDRSLIKKVKGNGEVQLSGVKEEEDERQNNRRVQMITLLRPPKPSILPDTLKVGDKITLRNIQFEGGTSLLLNQSVPAFKELLRALRQQPKYEVCIIGYVCCTTIGADGPDPETGRMNLSEVRAKTIYDSLLKNGIGPSRISYKGLGNVPTGKGEAADRRVEVQVTGIRE